MTLYRMLIFYARHEMIGDKTHGKFSFKQSEWLEKNINFITQKKPRLEMILTNVSINYSIPLFMEKIKKNCKRLKNEFFRKDDNEKVFKPQSN